MQNMTGEDLDQALRRIFRDVTRETAFSAAIAVSKLGFPIVAAAQMVSDIVLAKERGDGQ